jgi:murein DD-endopeptidase MepM/ murein hydrolase activator NlpD
VAEEVKPMCTGIRRTVASVAAIAISLVLIDVAATPHEASASADSERSTFVLTAFPHATSSASFWDSWGSRRPGGRRHRGIDIMSPRGTDVLAAADGVVTDFGWQRLSGYYIRIDHGGGWSTAYMHLNNDTLGTDDGLGGTWTAIYPTLTIGSHVQGGQVIGYVGDSGNAENTQPHIHFEVKKDGVKIDPYPFLEDAWDRQLRQGAGPLTPM